MHPVALTQEAHAKNATVKLSAEERNGIKAIATIRNRTPHFIMKEAIQLYLKRAESENLFIQSALKSREHLHKTGLHITQDEFSSWVKDIQSNPYAQIPKYHE
jgi:predicted transcriptional regulator